MLVLEDDALAALPAPVEIVDEQGRTVLAPIFGLGGVSLAISLGSERVAQIWQCGCGLLAPIISPRFSKICTAPMSGSRAELDRTARATPR